MEKLEHYTQNQDCRGNSGTSGDNIIQLIHA